VECTSSKLIAVPLNLEQITALKVWVIISNFARGLLESVKEGCFLYSYRPCTQHSMSEPALQKSPIRFLGCSDNGRPFKSKMR